MIAPEDRRHEISEALNTVRVWLGFVLLFAGSAFAWAIEHRNDPLAGDALITMAVTLASIFAGVAVVLTVYIRTLLKRRNNDGH